jgi:glycosyltransferase involved in cell wall biosynthesis
MLRWNWRDVYLKPRQDHYQLLREELGKNAVAYPFQADGSRNAGFLLPIAEFGEVEKVTYSVARELRRHGWCVHLFLMGNDAIALPPEFAGVFETINILPDPGAAAWGGGGSFQGTRLPVWHNGADTSAALGLLFWLDVVINCHSPGANEVMGQLRRFDVMTVDYLHVIDNSPLQMPVGHPVLSLAYEHGYDLIVTCSEALAHWMHAMGVPREKLLAAKNGPGFAMSEEQLAPLRAARDAFAPALRLLYMGRLDRQKGLRRLAVVVRDTRDSLPPVAWRIIGRNILKDDEAGIAGIEDLLEPPVIETGEILARLGWAHVLVLPSHWEGMPLMVIEALHCGVVVVATNTGAMAEIIEHGVNGFLVPNDERAAAEMTRIILRISRDRALLYRVALAAAQSAVNFSWERSVAPLAGRMEEKRAPTKPV